MRSFAQIYKGVVNEFVSDQQFRSPMTPITATFFNDWLFSDLQAASGPLK